MKQLTTIFAIHNHQPAGNFDNVIEEAYQKAYRPFLDVLARHRDVRFVQHWTGTLLEWVAAHHPETIDLMREMVRAGQLELLTGSYYEAILPIIPPGDAVGQIHKLSETLHRIFGVRPRGMWLAERVWEPHLVSLLLNADVEFVVLDDTHFKQAGLTDEQLRGYFVTEDQGRTLKVFPIDKTLRYTIPFRVLGETAGYFQGVAGDGRGPLVVHADDGEKFGVWPKTYATVYEEGWLESFCRYLDENRSWLHTGHFSEAIDVRPPSGSIYLPTASYPEMLKWSLPPGAFRRIEDLERRLKDARMYDETSSYLRTGFWRGFLAKYPEANHMHKKMLRLSRRAASYGERHELPQHVLDHLWAGQCNDPYWHGVFGGLYLPNLRSTVYRSLLEAERELDRLERLPAVRVENSDFDCDGSDEILVESDVANMYFKPSTGGCLIELDYKPAAVNVLDILSRREEGYHHRLRATGDEYRRATSIHDGVLAKEEGLHDYLSTDWYRRASFLDHFFGSQSTLDQAARAEHREVGDFVNQPYECSVTSAGNQAEVLLKRNGALWYESGPHRIALQKTLACRAAEGRIDAQYVITNLESRPVDVWLGIEFNVGFQAGDAPDRYYTIDGRKPRDSRLRSKGEEINVREVVLTDEWTGIEALITTDRPATVWRFPVETVSLSEAGFERLYQSSVVMLCWQFHLRTGPAGEFRVALSHTVRSFAAGSGR